MSWLDYYELLKKYGGDLSRATKEEMEFAAKCNPNDPPTARRIAERAFSICPVRIEVTTFDEDSDYMPCVVTKKKCGCYVAACVLDDDTLAEAAKVLDYINQGDRLTEHDLEKSSLLSQILETAKHGATLEVKPVGFVRSGGLTFDCKHSKQ